MTSILTSLQDTRHAGFGDTCRPLRYLADSISRPPWFIVSLVRRVFHGLYPFAADFLRIYPQLVFKEAEG